MVLETPELGCITCARTMATTTTDEAACDPRVSPRSTDAGLSSPRGVGSPATSPEQFKGQNNLTPTGSPQDVPPQNREVASTISTVGPYARHSFPS
jgi:hypothetical protein